MKVRRKLYGNAVTASCSICGNGRRSADGKVILCLHRGVVDPLSRCCRFSYDPLRRIPYTQPAPAAAYSEEDFRLE